MAALIGSFGIRNEKLSVEEKEATNLPLLETAHALSNDQPPPPDPPTINNPNTDEPKVSSQEEGPTVKKVIEVNDVPVYLPNHLLMDDCNHFKCVIYERIGFDDLVGGTYLATVHDKELVLRVEKTPARIVTQEFEFLKKIEATGEWLHFSQLHSAWQADGYAFYMVYHRGGPSFREVRDFMKNRTFSHGSAGRLMRDIFKCIHLVHKQNMLVRCMDSEMFHFDAASRNLFMSNLSTLRADAGKKEWDVPVLWAGGLHYAPLQKDNIHARDDIEAWLYLFIELVRGELPWSGKRTDEIQEIKASYSRDVSLVKGLPFVYTELYQLVMALPNNSPYVPEVCYTEIEDFCTRIAEQVGGVKSLDDNLDFERDPNESELPRFIMEKIAQEAPKLD
ncbi:unnamed protein product, partial [Mesorhabditis belari]|uniref:Protein kinase domain-containing protein n=1 Tax=Mesorhabditis belari TaxID=2138241 RepID=A0AAF3F019_9BILA